MKSSRVHDPLADRLDERHGVLLSPDQFAKLIGVGRTKAASLIASGAVESCKLGRLRKVSMRAVSNFIEELRREAPLDFFYAVNWRRPTEEEGR